MKLKGTLVILIIDANYNVTQDIIPKSVKKGRHEWRPFSTRYTRIILNLHLSLKLSLRTAILLFLKAFLN